MESGVRSIIDKTIMFFSLEVRVIAPICFKQLADLNFSNN
jgi:hypothetical protein